MKPSDVDLVATRCPAGVVIEIDDLGKHRVDNSSLRLSRAIPLVYCLLTGNNVHEDARFLRGVRLVKFDPGKKFIRVHLTRAARAVRLPE